MSIGSADLRKAIVSLWDSSDLDEKFSDLWRSSIVVTEYLTLHDQEAGPKQPFPYCVFEQGAGDTTDRMSGDKNTIREIRDLPCEFRCHARKRSGDTRTAAEIAAYLAEEVMKVFGGHPTEVPDDLTLDNGNWLITQYQNDYGIRTGDDEYQWIVSYLMRLDVPITVSNVV
jgi:hypothetical protein